MPSPPRRHSGAHGWGTLARGVAVFELRVGRLEAIGIELDDGHATAGGAARAGHVATSAWSSSKRARARSRSSSSNTSAPAKRPLRNHASIAKTDSNAPPSDRKSVV